MSGTIIDSLIVALKLDPANFISNADRAKEATAAIAGGVEELDKTGDKAGKNQAQRDREATARAKQEASDAAKRTKEQQRAHDAEVKERERARKIEQAGKDKNRNEEVRKEKEAERERTQANRKAAKERKEAYGAAKEAALGFGAALASIASVELLKNVSSGVANLGREAHNLDLPIGEIIAWGNAVASAVGGSADAARGSLKNLAGAMTGLRLGTDITTLPTLMGQLSRYSGENVSAKGPDGKFLNSEQLMLEFSKAGQHMDPKIYSGLMSGLLDDGSINLTEKGPASVQAAIDAAKARGVPGKAEADADAKLVTAATNLEQSFKRLGERLVFHFAPDLTRMLADMTSFGDMLSLKITPGEFMKQRAAHWRTAQIDEFEQKGYTPEAAAAAVDAGESPPPSRAVSHAERDVGHAVRDAGKWVRTLKRKLQRGGGAVYGPTAPDLPYGSIKPSANLAPDVEAYVRQDAAKRGVNPDWAVSIFRTEGGGYDKVSSAGAYGPAQLMPDTAAGLGVAAGPGDPDYRWQDNADAGVRYLAQLLHTFNGHRNTAAAAYNAGPNKYGVKVMASSGDMSELPLETQKYVRQVQANLVPGANAPVHHTSHNDNSSTSTNHIAKIEVLTNGDANAIAAGMQAAMKSHPMITPQANTGQE